MKPDIKVLLDQAKQPSPHYVPARAGWNGPEEKPANGTPNPIYEQLRREPSPSEVQQQLADAAIPDWRIILGLVLLVVTARAIVHRRPGKKPAVVVPFPLGQPDICPAPNAAEAA